MKNHMMIDVEALRLKQPWIAPLMSVGIVVFDPMGKVLCTEELFLNSAGCPEGFEAEPTTLDFWKGQDYFDKLLHKMEWEGKPTDEVLETIRTMYKEWDVRPVWFAGPTYDQVMLEAYYDSFGLDIPWGFSDSRDFRTIRKQHPEIYSGLAETRKGLHQAVEDSLFQVSVLRAIVEAEPSHPGWK